MINFDKNATTRTSDEVWDTMSIYAREEYGNPSALYSFAQTAKQGIEDSKEILSGIINCEPSEIYFVPSGSVGDNWIIRSMCRKGTTAITSEIEHHAVLNTFKALSDDGMSRVIYLPVDSNGQISMSQLEQHIESANLVSLMYVNNEIGTAQDIEAIGHLCRKSGVPFHTDAVQAFGKVEIDVDAQCIDFMTVSGHKFHGPKGIGFVHIREKYKPFLLPLVYGGSQQDGLIAGTENVPGIAGLALAAHLAYCDFEDKKQKTYELSWYLKSQLKIALPKVRVVNPQAQLGNCLSVSFLEYGVRGEELLEFLNEYDICASTGSACNSHDNAPSHVLKAIGLSDEEANATLRFSIDYENTNEEVDTVVKVLTEGVKMLGN